MRVIRELLLDGADGSVNQTSLHGLLTHSVGNSIQIEITGTLVGSLKLQGSSDPVPDSNFQAKTMKVDNWTDMLGSTQAITGSGTVMYNISDTFFNWVRVVYTSTSGTGTITAAFNAKGF